MSRKADRAILPEVGSCLHCGVLVRVYRWTTQATDPPHVVDLVHASLRAVEALFPVELHLTQGHGATPGYQHRCPPVPRLADYRNPSAEETS